MIHLKSRKETQRLCNNAALKQCSQRGSVAASRTLGRGEAYPRPAGFVSAHKEYITRDVFLRQASAMNRVINRHRKNLRLL